MDFAYFSLRLVLIATAAAAAVVAYRVSRRAQRAGRDRRLAGVGGLFLGAVTMVSLYDGVDNYILRPHDPVTLASWLWLLLVDLPMPVLAILLLRTREERDGVLEKLSELSVTDALTGLLNRRGFSERAALSIAQSRRTGTPSAVIMLDIDHFKAVNDGFGHDAGDQVLRALAVTMSAGRRAGDLVGRLGGEEFGLFLFASTEAGAAGVAEHVRAEVRRAVPHPGGPSRHVTVSGGVAPVLSGHEPENALSLALAAADKALYAAKGEGRDRIVVSASTLEHLPA